MRTHPPTLVLDGENLGVEICDPLPALLGEGKIPLRIADIGLHLFLEELRIVLAEIGSRRVA